MQSSIQRVPMVLRARRLLQPLLLAMVVSAGSVSCSGAGPLAGEACDSMCMGTMCNYTCEDDVIYHCGSMNKWRVEENCARAGLSCGTTDPDTADEGYFDYVCE